MTNMGTNMETNMAMNMATNMGMSTVAMAVMKRKVVSN